MNQNFNKTTVKQTIGNIQKSSDRQDTEEVRATYRAGSYFLSAAYKQFSVPSGNLKKFRNYKPNVSENLQKPKNIGQKPDYAKRIRTSSDPDIVMDRLKKFLLVQIIYRLSLSLSRKVVK